MGELTPTTKKQRTPAQLAAFEKCRKSREEAIIAKYNNAKQTPVPETADESPEAVTEHAPVTSTVTVAEPTGAKPMDRVAVATEHLPSFEEDDREFVDFDPDEFKTGLTETRAELNALKAQLEELQGSHKDLHSTFTSHGIKQAHMLNFV